MKLLGSSLRHWRNIRGRTQTVITIMTATMMIMMTLNPSYMSMVTKTTMIASRKLLDQRHADLLPRAGTPQSSDEHLPATSVCSDGGKLAVSLSVLRLLRKGLARRSLQSSLRNKKRASANPEAQNQRSERLVDRGGRLWECDPRPVQALRPVKLQVVTWRVMGLGK